MKNTTVNTCWCGCWNSLAGSVLSEGIGMA